MSLGAGAPRSGDAGRGNAAGRKALGPRIVQIAPRRR